MFSVMRLSGLTGGDIVDFSVFGDWICSGDLGLLFLERFVLINVYNEAEKEICLRCMWLKVDHTDGCCVTYNRANLLPLRRIFLHYFS
jgi:hypothetical protein